MGPRGLPGIMASVVVTLVSRKYNIWFVNVYKIGLFAYKPDNL